MDAVGIVIVVVVAIGLVVAATRLAGLLERVVVYDYERGLRYQQGRFAGVVEPGTYWLVRGRSSIVRFDVRPGAISVPGQEVITADGVSIRISLAAQYAVVDPAVAVNEHQSYQAALYLALQVALRDVVAETEIDGLLESRATIGARIAELVQEKAVEMGLRLDSVEAKDFMFPGDLRKAFAQPVIARKEGVAALERARGETAALRNLANAARILEANPTLMQLRVLQQIGGTAGNTVVLGLAGSATPLPVRAIGEEAPAVEPPSDQ